MTEPLLNDSIKAGAIGGSSLVARILASDEDMRLITTVRRAVAAMVTAWVVNYYLMENVQSTGLRAVACGLAGMSSGEVIEFATKWVKAKGSGLVAKAEAEAGIKLKPKPKKKVRNRGKR